MSAQPPDEAAFRAALLDGDFQAGALSGRWGLHTIEWPSAKLWVRAADGAHFGFKFDCTDYPQTAPTAQLWDVDADGPLPLEQWPTGAVRVPMAFNPNWNRNALYLPCDRLAIQGHENWRHQHPSLLWDPLVGVVRYLGVVSDLLCSGDYGGRRG